jgi:hypothetical protein
VIGMRILEMGIFDIVMVGRLFKKGRFERETCQLVKCVFNVFDGGTLVLEDMNEGIEIDNVGFESLYTILVLDVIGNQGIQVLGACIF